MLLFDRPLMHSPHPNRDTQDSRICARETLTLAIHLRCTFFFNRLTEEIRVVAAHYSLTVMFLFFGVRSVPASVIVQGLQDDYSLLHNKCSQALMERSEI